MDLSRHRGIAVILAALGATALLVAFVLVSQRSDDSGLQAQGPPLYEHVAEFQALADEHGDRAAGTPGYEAAAQYVEQQLEGAGYQSTRQYFTFDSYGEETETFSIIAETEGGSDDNVIMLGAHLDGMPDSPAISDNAAGVAALLETAKELGGQDAISNKVRFAWWGAEEFPSTPGSRHYVENLAEPATGELDNIIAYINIDMVASPNYVIGLYDARESDPELEVPDGSTEIMNVFTDYFGSRGQPWVTTHWDFDSDQVPFVEEDVAVAGLFTGSNEKKSTREAALFGGASGQPRDPNYHASGDDLDNISFEALTLMTDAMKSAATSLAEDSSTLSRHER